MPVNKLNDYTIIHHNTQTFKQSTGFYKYSGKLKEMYIIPVAHCQQISSVTCK